MKKFVIIALLAVAAFTAKAQEYLNDPRYGNTPEERKENVLILNYFNEAYQSNDYNQALVYFNQLLTKAPKASENIYISGANIFKNKIARATSLAQKKALTDSLMMVYDERMKNYGDHATRGKAYILDMKARDYLTYKPTDTEGLHQIFKVAMDEAGQSVDPELVNIYFQMLANQYQADKIEVDVLIAEYQKLAPIFDIDQTPERAEAKKIFDARFVASGAANCDNLENLFKPKIQANPTDISLIEKAFGGMSKLNCTSDFYYDVVEKYYAIKPTTEVAMALATVYENKKDNVKALKYLNEALASETNPAAKANLCIHTAGIELKNGNSRNAATLARQAMELDPNNGYAILILAQSYGAGAAASCSGFDRAASCWLIYDLLSDARKNAASDAALTTQIDAQIASYRAAFPSKEECFFRGLQNGAGYTVNCGWVSGRTTVREGR